MITNTRAIRVCLLIFLVAFLVSPDVTTRVLIILPDLCSRAFQILFCLGMVGIDAKGLLEVSHRTRQVSPNREHFAQVVVGVSVIWVDAKRLFEVAESLIKISLNRERLTKIVMSVRIVRLTPQHLAKVDDRFLGFALR
jgi:hypothetical protein